MRLLGPYALHEPLGAGGMGVVWRGVDQRTGAPVAVKTVRVPSDQLRAALRREIAALARVDHPGVVRILDRGVDGDEPWYAMPWVEGQPLSAWMRPTTGADGTWWTSTLSELTPEPAPGRGEAGPRAAPFDPTGPIRWLRALCAPLAWLHGEGFVHRDLKPANVVIGSDDRPVVVDFGLSWRNLEVRDRVDVGELRAGTPHYMAPEQVRGELVDARADLYALGCLIYEALAGRPPHGGSTAAEVLGRHLAGPPQPLEDLVPDLPAPVGRLVSALLEPDRRRRVGHAEEVDAALAEAGVPDPDWRDAPPPRPVLYRPGLVGRRDVVAALDRALDEGSGAVWLEGDSGIGKTRLALEALGRAQARGWRTVVAACTEVAFVPLEPLREALALGRMVLAAPNHRDDRGEEVFRDHQSHRFLTAAIAALHELGGQRPTLLLVDDLHWADRLTVAVLERVAASPVPGLLVVGTARPGEAQERVLRLPGRHVRLDALDRADLAAIAGEILARFPPPEAVVEVVADAARGNPFLAAEAVRSAVADGFLRRSAGRWEVDPARRPGASADGVLRRLAKLGDAPLAVARALSVLGRPVVPEAAREVAGLDEVAFDAAVHELSRRAVVEDTGATLALAHDRLREALRDGVPDATGHHRRAAAALARHGAASVEVAAHLEACGDGGAASRAYAAAAGDALAYGEYAECTRCFERAIALTDDPAAAIAWSVELLDITIEEHDNPTLRRRLAALEARLGDLPVDHPRRWRTHVVGARLGIRLGEPQESERRIALASRSSRTPAQRRRTERLVADLTQWRGSAPPDADALHEAVARARIDGAPASLAAALWHLAKGLVHHVDPSVVDPWIDEAVGLYRSVGAEVDVAHLLNLRTETARRRGDLAVARAAAEEGLTLYARNHRPVGQADMWNVLGDLDRQAGDLEGAVRAYGLALEAYRAHGHFGAEITELNLAIAQCELGRHAACRAATDGLIARFRERQRRPLEAMARVAQLPALAGLGDWDALAAQLDAALAQLDATGFTDADVPRSAWLAVGLARARRPDLAARLAELTAAHADRVGDPDLAARARAVARGSG